MTARKVLGVSESAPFSDISRRYKFLAKRFHPDVIGTGDAEQFILVNTAYVILQAEDIGIENQIIADGDISGATKLQMEIDYYFDNLLYEFRRHRKAVEEQTRRYIQDTLASADSSENIKNIIKSRIEGHLTDTKVEIETFIKRLMKNASVDNQDYIFNMFKEMYKNRRITWLKKIYKNPIFTSGLLVQGLFLLVRFYPQLRLLSHDVFPILPSIGVQIVIGVFFVGLLAFQYILLNPRRQFLPPKLSLNGFNKLIEEQISKVGNTHFEVAAGGALIGGIAGSFILPGLGTAIGAVVGGIFGAFFGETIYEIRNKAEQGIMVEFTSGLQQVENAVLEWIEQSKVDIRIAAVESFKENCQKVGSLLDEGKISLRLLPNGTPDKNQKERTV